MRILPTPDAHEFALVPPSSPKAAAARQTAAILQQVLSGADLPAKVAAEVKAGIGKIEQLEAAQAAHLARGVMIALRLPG